MLSSLATTLIKYTLQEAVDELVIVNDGKTYAVVTEIPKPPMSERFKNPHREKVFGEHPADAAMLFVKLENDMLGSIMPRFRTEFTTLFSFSSNLRQVLSETIVQLDEHSTCETLNQTLARAKQVDQEEYDLIASCVRNKKQLAKIEEQLKQEAVTFEQQEKALDERIYDLENELQEVSVEHKVKLRFVKNWVASRRAEAELALKKQNDTLERDFLKSEDDLNNEILTADNIKSKDSE
jgi:hypothetical protein